MDPFKWLYHFPPINKRPRLEGLIRYFVFSAYDRTIDETYVYYRVSIINLWINGFFMALYAASFFFQQSLTLGWFHIVYQPDAPVDGLVYGYPHLVFPIIAAVTTLYSITLFMFKTDYLSKQRIINEQTPIAFPNPRLYEIKPLSFLFTLLFLVGTGFVLWHGPEILREYVLFNLLHDFSAHEFSNFLLVALFYFAFYQCFYCPMFSMTTVNLVRSTLRHYVYGKEIHNLKKETDYANDD